jgi:hypothetical protein
VYRWERAGTRWWQRGPRILWVLVAAGLVIGALGITAIVLELRGERVIWMFGVLVFGGAATWVATFATLLVVGYRHAHGYYWEPDPSDDPDSDASGSPDASARSARDR